MFILKKKEKNKVKNGIYTSCESTNAKNITTGKFNIYKKFLVIADTHGTKMNQIEKIKNIDYDICLILGDISFDELRLIKNCVDKPIVAIPGNHDTTDIYEKAGIPCYHGKNVEIDGITFACAGGSTKYKKSPYCMYTELEMKAIMENLSTADVLMTHDSMFREEYENNPAKCGFYAIENYINTYQPKMHIYGHLHIPQKKVIGNTIDICCFGIQTVDTNGDINTIE